MAKSGVTLAHKSSLFEYEVELKDAIKEQDKLTLAPSCSLEEQEMSVNSLMAKIDDALEVEFNVQTQVVFELLKEIETNLNSSMVDLETVFNTLTMEDFDDLNDLLDEMEEEDEELSEIKAITERINAQLALKYDEMDAALREKQTLEEKSNKSEAIKERSCIAKLAFNRAKGEACLKELENFNFDEEVRKGKSVLVKHTRQLEFNKADKLHTRISNYKNRSKHLTKKLKNFERKKLKINAEYKYAKSKFEELKESFRKFIINAEIQQDD